jgi:hypothetical protein
MIDAALQDLGRAIHGTLEDYLERNEEASDFGWGKETYGKRGE